MFNHPGVRLNQRQGRGVFGAQGKVFAEDALEHLGDVRHGFVEVQIDELHLLFAGKQQQLARETGGAFGGVGNLVGGVVNFFRLEVEVLEQRGVALDDGQDVVEIMGNAAG